MATLLVHIRVKPGTEARFEAAARGLYHATHANETKMRHYEYWRGREPGQYYAFLSFDDYNGFLDHQSSEHHENPDSGLGESMAELDHEWLDPVGGASPLVPTNMQELGADANESARRYHETMPAEVQEWWQALRDAAGL